MASRTQDSKLLGASRSDRDLEMCIHIALGVEPRSRCIGKANIRPY